MRKFASWMAAAFLFLLGVMAEAKIVETPIEYKEGSASLQGTLVFDDSLKGKLPGVLIVHDWMGPSELMKEKARGVAKLGYAAFVADIYGKEIRPKDAGEAKKATEPFYADRKLLRARANAGLEQLKKAKQVDSSRLAVMGYCFGGTTALELARSGADLKGAVSFHGGLQTPDLDDAKNVKAKILVLHGADDPFVPLDQVNQFEKEMTNAKVDWQLVKYSKAVHSFTNPKAGNDNSKGSAYNALADQRSWQAMKNFFGEVFKK